jgi:hypothetical protein
MTLIHQNQQNQKLSSHGTPERINGLNRNNLDYLEQNSQRNVPRHQVSNHTNSQTSIL